MVRRSLRSINVADFLHDTVERTEFCDLLDKLGPHAPTLLDPWTTLDLAAHLVLREHDVFAAPGLVIPGAWGRFAEQRCDLLEQVGLTDLVATIRSGPPPGFFRIGWVRRNGNLNEFFVHHEDVRRANGLGPRTIPPAEQAALFRNVAVAPWFLSRRLNGAGLELVSAGTDKVIRARRGSQPLACLGFPARYSWSSLDDATPAEVELTGSSEAVEAVRRTSFGM